MSNLHNGWQGPSPQNTTKSDLHNMRHETEKVTFPTPYYGVTCETRIAVEELKGSFSCWGAQRNPLITDMLLRRLISNEGVEIEN